jgi:3-oxoacyl-[acyl-carrier-protein] synthase III
MTPSKQRTRILGTGRYLPERVVTNDELSNLLDTSDEWIQQRSGIKERRYAASHETPTSMACTAALAAMEMAGVGPQDIDYLICSTQTPEYYAPGTACLIQAALGLNPIGALDIRNQCTGFIYGISLADAFIQMGTYKRILLVCPELNSRGLEFSDRGRQVTVLFGDGAGAVVLGQGEEEGRGLLSVEVHSDGRFAKDLILEAPGFAFPEWCTEEQIRQGKHFMQMNGKVVFKEAVSCMRRVIESVLSKNQLVASQIDYLIPHQANRRINEAVSQYFQIDESKVNSSIERYGNCASASVPIALDEWVREGKIQPGQLLMFATFAAGFTWGGAALRW